MVNKIEPDENIILLLNAIRKDHSEIVHPYKKVTKKQFLQIKPPVVDIETDSEVKWHLTNYNKKYIAAAGSLLKAICITNSIVYPPHSMMDWHTNSNHEGIRTYYTYTEEEAIFRYVDANGKIKLDYDNVGWTCRTFKIQKDNPLWHSVWTKSKRYSFGFVTNDIDKANR